MAFLVFSYPLLQWKASCFPLKLIAAFRVIRFSSHSSTPNNDLLVRNCTLGRVDASVRLIGVNTFALNSCRELLKLFFLCTVWFLALNSFSLLLLIKFQTWNQIGFIEMIVGLFLLTANLLFFASYSIDS